jgi:endonuclease G
MAETERIQRAYEIALKRFGHRAEVTGVDIGYKYKDGRRGEQVVLRVHLREKLAPDLVDPAQLLPREIDGVPLDVVQGSYAPSGNGILALAARRHRRDPVQPGLSISHHLGTAGTIGAIVYDRTDGAACILSNKHVLAEAALAEAGDQILQPGRIDGGRRDHDAIARLRRMYLGVKGDAAIAALNQSRQTRTALYGGDVEIRETRRARVGDLAAKSGRSTGITDGRVDGVGRFKVRYGFQDHWIEGFKLRTQDQANPGNLELTRHGDSGALWYDPVSEEGLGLHFAGEDDSAPAAEFALACHLDAVLDELMVSLTPVAPEDFIAPGDVPDPADPPPSPPAGPTLADLLGGGAPEGADSPVDPASAPSGPTLADLLSGAGASEETLGQLDHGEACAAAMRDRGLSVVERADGSLEIIVDPDRTRGKVRITFEPN